MARATKRHVQQRLYFGDKNGERRGNPNGRKRRKGVKLGRPPKGKRSSERHKTRAAFRASEPVHVTLRVADDIARLGLRKRSVYRAVREAMLVTYSRENCRIVHLSIQDSHVHLLVEAENRLRRVGARRMHAIVVGTDEQALGFWEASDWEPQCSQLRFTRG